MKPIKPYLDRCKEAIQRLTDNPERAREAELIGSLVLIHGCSFASATKYHPVTESEGLLLRAIFHDFDAE